MRIIFWGTRGSIPAPGPQTVRYGGNTTCIEVRTDAGEIIILDAGTGIRALGIQLLKSVPIQCNILVTHTHWDHIHGLPFFGPIFRSDTTISFFGPTDPVHSSPLTDILTTQLKYNNFPVVEAELNSTRTYQSLHHGEQFTVNDATITPVLMHHPVTNLGYRIDCNGKSLFFTGDHEPLYNIYEPGSSDHEDYEQIIEERYRSIYDLLGGLDLMIADSSYTTQEYPNRLGWGHGTFASCLKMAKAVGTKALVFTHHDPARSDEELDVIKAALDEAHQPGDPELTIAHEGLEICL